MAGKAHFVSPQIQDNPDGWGPCAVPNEFKEIPYQPFSKGDRLGKVSFIKFTNNTHSNLSYSELARTTEVIHRIDHRIPHQ